MVAALVDSTVIIHLFRLYKPALNWYQDQSESLGLVPISWMEGMIGAGSKAKMLAYKEILQQFRTVFLTESDQRWAMQQLERFRLSHGSAVNDCLIASAAFRLQVPLYTHNLKDM